MTTEDCDIDGGFYSDVEKMVPETHKSAVESIKYFYASTLRACTTIRDGGSLLCHLIKSHIDSKRMYYGARSASIDK